MQHGGGVALQGVGLNLMGLASARPPRASVIEGRPVARSPPPPLLVDLRSKLPTVEGASKLPWSPPAPTVTVTAPATSGPRQGSRKRPRAQAAASAAVLRTAVAIETISLDRERPQGQRRLPVHMHAGRGPDARPMTDAWNKIRAELVERAYSMAQRTTTTVMWTASRIVVFDTGMISLSHTARPGPDNAGVWRVSVTARAAGRACCLGRGPDRISLGGVHQRKVERLR